MASLRCCSYNWINGLISLNSHVDSFDIIFIQEHWLIDDQLHKIGDLLIDFSFVGVSGMDDSSLLTGRPFGGCSILYRKTLLPCVTPLSTHSKRFCAIRMSGSSRTTLLICVYLPSKSITSCYNEYPWGN